MTLEQVLGEVVARLGIRGVSLSALALLVSVVAWSSRAKKAGSAAGSAVGTARWVAVSLVALAVAGIVSINFERAVALAGRLGEYLPRVLRWLGGLI